MTELYVLLGTCHTSMASPLAATWKAYETPLGAAPVNHDFLDLLEARSPADLHRDDFSHRAEHSLEFQAIDLCYLGRINSPAGAAVVPLLCGSLHECVSPDESPLAVDLIAETLAVLRGTLAKFGRRVCLIAGADLAHVGPQFGDQYTVTPAIRSTASGLIRPARHPSHSLE